MTARLFPAQVFIAIAICLAAMLAALTSAQAQEQRRIALVIGNNAYETVPVLAKAVNDADAVSARLAEIGFQVTTARDIGRRAFSRAVLEFENSIQPGDLALFYYAGHGFAISGQNFLLPVDIPPAGPGEEALVADEAFLADDLADRFQKAGASTVVLVLDACRDNPFAVPGKRSLGGEAGLTRMSPAEGVFVLFSAGIGQSALDRLSDNDANPNSVFTRSFLKELDQPNLPIVNIAKATQVAVRDLAAQIGHLQTPAYYDQIIGTVMLNPDANAATRGATQDFKEGDTVAVLKRIDPQPKEGKAKPIASFQRSNQGWQVTISLPEPALQFGYRVGEDGEFTDTGLMPNIDQRTGQPMPVTWFQLPGDQAAVNLFVTWRDKRGEEAGVFPVRFDPDNELKANMKQMIDMTWTSWVSFREFNGRLIYFSGLQSFSCGLSKIEYAYNGTGEFVEWPLQECDPANPYSVRDNAKLYDNVPKNVKNVQVRVTYFDGTVSKEQNYNAKF